MITFDDSSREFILSAFGYSVDKDGYIVNAQSGQRALASDGKEIRAAEFIGIADNKLFRSNLVSLIELSDRV